jgi:hypothetical protein
VRRLSKIDYAASRSLNLGDGKLFRTDGKFFHTDGKVFHTDGKIIRTDGKISRTDGKVFRTDGKIFRTDGKVWRRDTEVGAGVQNLSGAVWGTLPAMGSKASVPANQTRGPMEGIN